MALADWKPAPILVEHLEQRPPATLYHYTNQTGLLGILKEKVLWASNIHYLNDHQEFNYGVTLFYDHIRAECDKAADDRRRHLESILERMDQQVHPQTALYVASWSAEDDDLAQWRAYSGSETGYAIGMGGATINELANEQQFVFAACIYDQNLQVEWARQIVETSLNEMMDDEKKGIEYHRATPGDKLLYRLLRFAPLIKHPKFHGEKEWRLIADFPGVEMHAEFSFRLGRSSLIPHFRFKLELPGKVAIAVSEIVVGPCAEPALAQRAAMLALMAYVKGNNGGRYSVRVSAVPHRNW